MVAYHSFNEQLVYRKIKSGKENIVLTGMPGSGKSTVGKLLSEKLGRPYFDVDECITEKTGRTPAALIAAEGEAAGCAAAMCALENKKVMEIIFLNDDIDSDM